MNLPRTRALLRLLGDPQESFPSVLVAGTKGKGSTAVLIEAMARAAGFHTGLWTSPHLHTYRERIQVDRQPISQAELIDLVERTRPALERYDRAYGEPTTFEIGLLLALQHFAARRVGLAVLEIGVGGRFDNTNAVTPLLSVIASLSYDHMDILGDTIEQIAFQKAGIIKPGIAAITVPQLPGALPVLSQAAAEVTAPLWLAEGTTVTQIVPQGAPTAPLDLTRLIVPGQHPTPRLPGLFQRQNASLAVGAALLLRQAGLPIDDPAIAAGLADAWWPGRMEIVPGTPPVVLDGAHNGDSAEKLVAALRDLFPDRRLVLVVGVSFDKLLAPILSALAPAAAALVVTRSQHPRALADLDALAASVAQHLPAAAPDVPIVRAPTIAGALEQARALAGPDGLVCVTGSLFVVAAAREALGLAAEID